VVAAAERMSDVDGGSVPQNMCRGLVAVSVHVLWQGGCVVQAFLLRIGWARAMLADALLSC
jgi:hypothetical protein